MGEVPLYSTPNTHRTVHVHQAAAGEIFAWISWRDCMRNPQDWITCVPESLRWSVSRKVAVAGKWVALPSQRVSWNVVTGQIELTSRPDDISSGERTVCTVCAYSPLPRDR